MVDFHQGRISTKFIFWASLDSAKTLVKTSILTSDQNGQQRVALDSNPEDSNPGTPSAAAQFDNDDAIGAKIAALESTIEKRSRDKSAKASAQTASGLEGLDEKLSSPTLLENYSMMAKIWLPHLRTQPPKSTRLKLLSYRRWSIKCVQL